MKPTERLFKVFDMFVSNDDKYISSTEAKKKLQIGDRKAILQDISVLREHGCEFDARTRKGFKMTKAAMPEEWVTPTLSFENKEAVKLIRNSISDPGVEHFLNYAFECIAYRKISEGELPGNGIDE